MLTVMSKDDPATREPTLIEKLSDEYLAIAKYLEENNEISFLNSLESMTPKVLLLAGASHLEQLIQEVIIDYFQEITTQNEIAVSFVINKAVKRQYHTYFKWDENNANAFFALFGDEFKAQMKAKVKRDEDFDRRMQAFLELGRIRNQLVHKNYATFSLNKTSEEIVKLYHEALEFVRTISACLHSGFLA